MKQFKDIEIQNSVTIIGKDEVTLESLLIKVHNNFVCGEVNADEGMELLKQIVSQINNQ